jgi:hypothetical protein
MASVERRVLGALDLVRLYTPGSILHPPPFVKNFLQDRVKYTYYCWFRRSKASLVRVAMNGRFRYCWR